MEELLNKLMDKGWRPRGHTNFEVCDYNNRYDRLCFENKDYVGIGEHSLRELVSKESGLWQFVCENNLVDYDTESGWGEFSFNTDYINGFYGKHIFESNYQYRLIESALKDESELEDFLLNSIKIEGIS